MDPITLIVTAVAAGAALAGKDVAGEAVRDAYNGLKTLIIRKFGSAGAVEASVEQVEQNPQSETWQKALGDGLKQSGADNDAELTQQAQALLDLIKASGQGDTISTVVNVSGSGAAAVGPGAVAAGEGGIAIGGSVQGGIRTGGDEPQDS